MRLETKSSPRSRCGRLSHHGSFRADVRFPTNASPLPLHRRNTAAILTAICLPFTGQLLHAHGAYHDVVGEIEARLAGSPDDPALHYKLAEAHLGHEEWLLGLDEIQTVEGLAPGEYPTGYLRGWALHLGGRQQEALESLDGFLSATPDHAKALAIRGRVRMKLADPDAAAADFAKALQLGNDPEPEHFVELAEARVAAKDSPGAVAALDEGIRKLGPLPQLLLAALDIESTTQAWDSALARIDILQGSSPRPEPWMARRATLLATAGRHEVSRAAWTALRDHLLSLPSLERGTPRNLQLLKDARHALGESVPEPVAAPPAP